MKKKLGSRLLSTLLALTMMLSYLGFFAPVEAEAAAVIEYATPATEEELNTVARWFAANNGAADIGTFAKIINGILYVWGSNQRNSTGLTGLKYKDNAGNLVDVATGTSVPVPTPMGAEAFNNEKCRYVVAAVSCFYVLTEGTGINGDTGNNIYTYGMQAQGGGYGTRTSPNWNVYKLNTDNIHNAGRYVVRLKTHGCAVFAQDDIGGWWSATCGSSWVINMQNNESTGKVAGTFYAIPTAITSKMGGGIIDITGMWNYATLAIGANGKMYGFGSYGNPGGNCIGVPEGKVPSGQTNVNGIDYGAVYSQLTNVRFKSCNGEDWSSVAVSTDGDVWAWGLNSSSKFGENYSESDFDATHKVFDHNVYQKKAVRAWTSSYRLVVLCDDNTVYAMGDNSNGVIIPGGGATVNKLTQILSNISQNDTIVGVFPTNVSQMCITKAGDMYFAGDNASGAAGNGTTASAPAGETTTVTSPSMPPTQPLTKNLVTFELEVENKVDNTTEYYTPTKAGNGTQYIKKVGATESTVSNITLDAGSNFKLNVYFEDFGKMNTFVMPIRFDPRYLEVVNGNGKAYSRASEVITPGSLGPSVGIEQTFDIDDWNGGSLAIGTKDGTYPKISNADGWVSVAGYSADTNPIIKGKVKMFSISFRARTTVTGNGIAFDYATDENIPEEVNTLGYGYDVTCNGLEHCKAYWSLYNASGDGGESGYFEFDTEPFPKFNSKLVILTSLGMNLTYGATNTVVPEATEADDVEHTPGWVINWSNTSVTYTVNALPYHKEGSNNKAPGASFPQVDWSFDTVKITGANNLNREWEDYITIVDQEDTFVKFKINPNFHAVADEDDGYIRVTATSQHYTSVVATYYIVLRSFNAPDTLEIAQKDSTGALVQLGDDQTMIYHYRSDESENRQFFVDFGTAHNNLEVVWTLLDKDGDPIDLSDPAAKVTLTKGSDGSATIEPHYTTTGDDYVILHVESLYSSEKFDEVKIKVQLYTTNLGFTPNTIRMAVMKEGMPSTVDLSKYLKVSPVDVYATDYTWTIESVPTRDPANATDVDPSFESGVTPVNYGSMGSGSTAATFTAFEWATPVASENGSELEEFVTVRVTENLSGKTADVKIAIMDLDCPIGIDQFVATNNLGTQNDTVLVKDGLQLGDRIEFYPTYEDAMNKTKRWNNTTIVEGMYPQFTFYVGDRSDSVMKGEGGFIAVRLYRVETAGQPETEYDPVPISYSSEPSLVDGYIHLFGKNTGSIADKDIRVDLEGLNFKETVYTNSSGYFKFTKYIAPGTYNMVVSKKNYLTRRMEANSSGVGGIEIQVNDEGEFHISTYNQPILLFPGELTNDNAITVQDINYYVANWVGQYDGNITDFELYDFLEDNLISAKDLELLLMRKDWISGSYPVWNVPSQR